MLVTFHHNEKRKAEEEVAKVLRDAGIGLEDMMESIVPGLLYIRVSGDAKRGAGKLRDLALRFPEMFLSTHRWIPIEQWVRSTPESLTSAARMLGERIGEDERWRIDLEKRKYDGGSTLDLVRMLADAIDRGTVDLKDPEKVLMVQVIGEFAGFSLLTPEEMLDVNEMRVMSGLQKVY